MRSKMRVPAIPAAAQTSIISCFIEEKIIIVENPKRNMDKMNHEL